MKKSFTLLFLMASIELFAATLLPNFQEKRVLDNLDATGMCILPDNRIVITEKGGGIWLLNTNETSQFLYKIPNVDTYFERGLQTVVADPDFTENGFLYFYFTYKDNQNNQSFNRIQRFTFLNNSIDVNSSKIIFDLPALTAGNHNGGGLVFGKDGKFYISTGDNAVANYSQIQDHLFGKILRINSDGTIPTDNPYYTTNTGNNKAIYAMGLRNPFKLKINNLTGEILINEVGQNTWEEINILSKEANYGWPLIEGKRTTQTAPTNYQDPIYAYNHANGNCSITGGTFYSPQTSTYPAQYFEKYFFMDYCAGTISYIDPKLPSATLFASGLQGAVDMDYDQNGNIFYLQRGAISNNATAGELWKISYSNAGNVFISVQPKNTTCTLNSEVHFEVQAHGSGNIVYQWFKNGIEVQNSNNPVLIQKNISLSDDGALYKVKVSNETSFEISQEVVLNVQNNHAPKATIVSPEASFLYEGGIILSFSGTGFDQEDGNLPASAFSWKIDFHHNTHVHPGMDLVTGINAGTFQIPNEGETSDNVWYRIHLTVTDNEGISTSVYKDIFPKKITLILQTSPAGIPILLDGSPIMTPYTLQTVVGIKRTIETPFHSVLNNNNYLFQDWNLTHKSSTINLLTPNNDSMFVAHYISTKIDTISPIADTYVRSGDNANSIFGITDATHLMSKKDDSNLHTNREIYLRFPLEKYETILSAFVQLTGAKENTTVASIPVNIYALSDTTWDENTLTWNTKLVSESAILDSQFVHNVVPNQTHYQWNVTNHLQSENSDENNLVSYSLNNPISTPSAYTVFNSKEAIENKPMLIVFYDTKLTTSYSDFQNLQNEIILSPNPAHSTETINIQSSDAIKSIQVYDITGNPIKTKTTESNNTLNLNQFHTGIYFIHLFTIKGSTVKKLVIN